MHLPHIILERTTATALYGKAAMAAWFVGQLNEQPLPGQLDDLAELVDHVARELCELLGKPSVSSTESCASSETSAPRFDVVNALHELADRLRRAISLGRATELLWESYPDDQPLSEVRDLLAATKEALRPTVELGRAFAAELVAQHARTGVTRFDVDNALDELRQGVDRALALLCATEDLFESFLLRHEERADHDRPLDRFAHLLGATREATLAALELGHAFASEIAKEKEISANERRQ